MDASNQAHYSHKLSCFKLLLQCDDHLFAKHPNNLNNLIYSAVLRFTPIQINTLFNVNCKESGCPRSTNFRLSAEPGNRSRVVEVEGAADSNYANLTPENSPILAR